MGLPKGCSLTDTECVPGDAGAGREPSGEACHHCSGSFKFLFSKVVYEKYIHTRLCYIDLVGFFIYLLVLPHFGIYKETAKRKLKF